MTMILLTPQQANLVRGRDSNTTAIEPIELKNGKFVLPLSILDDVAHNVANKVLKAVTTIPDPAPEEYKDYFPPKPDGSPPTRFG